MSADSSEVGPAESVGDRESQRSPGESESTAPRLEEIPGKIRRELAETNSPEGLRRYLLLNREALARIPVALLNAWVQVPELRFYRNHGLLGLRKTESRKDPVAALSKRLDQISAVVDRHSRDLKQILDYLKSPDPE
jgi:hypothetical protein